MERTNQTTDTTGRGKASKDVGKEGAEETSEEIKNFLVLLKKVINKAILPGSVCPKNLKHNRCPMEPSSNCPTNLCEILKLNLQNIIEIAITDSRLKENVEDLSFSFSPKMIFKNDLERFQDLSFVVRVFRIIDKNNKQHLNISIIVEDNNHCFHKNNISLTVKDGPSLINFTKLENMNTHITILFNPAYYNSI